MTHYGLPFLANKVTGTKLTLLPQTTKKTEQIRGNNSFQDTGCQVIKTMTPEIIMENKGGEPYNCPRLLLRESFQAKVPREGAQAEQDEVSLS